jgi:hypothetical protein
MESEKEKRNINTKKKHKSIFSTGISDTFPAGVCNRQVAILLRLLGITIIISPPYH